MTLKLRFILCFILLAIPLPVTVQAQATLGMAEKYIDMAFNVDEVNSDELLKLMNDDKGKIAVFDVREPDEFVSRIPSAVRVPPGISAEDFFKTYSPKAAGKTAVFYCSVGLRSAKLIERLNQSNSDKLTFKPVNLRGGIFRWHSGAFPVVDSEGKATQQVVGYKQSLMDTPTQKSKK